MNINVKVKSGKEFEGYLRILASVPPFSLLRPRELQVLPELYAPRELIPSVLTWRLNASQVL